MQTGSVTPELALELSILWRVLLGGSSFVVSYLSLIVFLSFLVLRRCCDSVISLSYCRSCVLQLLVSVNCSFLGLTYS